MNDWRKYVLCRVDEVTLEFIPKRLEALTSRVVKGQKMVKDPNLDEETKAYYEHVLKLLTGERDMLAALLRFRDEELFQLLGPAWDSKHPSEEAIFEKLVNFQHLLQPNDRLLGEDAAAKAEHADLVNRINKAAKTEEGKGLLAAMDTFSSMEYDYGNIPQFYCDICKVLNATVVFYEKVWANNRKKPSKKDT